MSSQLSPETTSALHAIIDKTTSGPSPSIPGLVYCAVNRAGDVIFSHASGKRGLDSSDPMTLDNVFWIASCTKLITSIACMQLVEQAVLKLDDADQVETLSPELRDVRVLERTPEGEHCLAPKKRSITLRMLLTHTCKVFASYNINLAKLTIFVSAGFGYAFDDLRLCDWARPVGLDDFSGHKADVLHRPLVNQPGTRFQYGVGMDWVGVIVERAAQMSLEEYFQKRILGPMGITNITFFPTTDMKAKLAYMHQREERGNLTVRDHLYRYPLLPSGSSDEKRFCMGGAGCFGKPMEYCRKSLAPMKNVW